MSDLPAASHNARYLDARVTTASQPELQLMLLEGALRFGQRALHLWHDAAERVPCDGFLARSIDIVEELVRGVAGGKAEASQRLEEEYAFVFRQLASAQFSRDSDRLVEALELLKYHRETWKLVCENLKTQIATTPAALSKGGHSSAPAPLASDAFFGGGRLSIEA